MGYIGKINVDRMGALPIGSTLFFVCNTAASSNPKSINTSVFSNTEMLHGLTIQVLFTYGNTFSGNVGNPLQLGIYPINSGFADVGPYNIIGNLYLKANEIVSLTFDSSAATPVWRVNSANAYQNYVTREEFNSISTSTEAMVFMGALGNSAEQVSALPTYGYKKGWTYKVAEIDQDNYGFGNTLNLYIGDTIIAVENGPEEAPDPDVLNPAHWTRIESGIDQYILGPSTAPTAGHLAVFSDSTGKQIIDGGSIANLFVDGTGYEYANDNKGATVKYVNNIITAINTAIANQNIFYFSCSTAAGTAAKVISSNDFTLVDGRMVIVKFDYTNTAPEQITLKIGDENATAVKVIIDSDKLKSNVLYFLRYNENYDVNEAAYEVITGLSDNGNIGGTADVYNGCSVNSESPNVLIATVNGSGTLTLSKGLKFTTTSVLTGTITPSN